jgi:N,N'-diacetylchitobiose transport system permease protein
VAIGKYQFGASTIARVSMTLAFLAAVAVAKYRFTGRKMFILGIPKDLEEAAMVDGSTRLGAFIRILLPLVAPGLVATSVFAFITSWNEYIFARILLNDQSKQTVTVWLSYFLGSSRHTDWGALMAGSTLTAIPVVVFFLLVQRKIAFGLTAGAVRG